MKRLNPHKKRKRERDQYKVGVVRSGRNMTKYRPEFAVQARRLIGTLGIPMYKLAPLFGVDVSSLDYWVANYPEFEEAVKGARLEYGAKVAKALHMRATGFEVASEKIFCLKNGEVVRVPYMKYFPPDPGAAIKYLQTIFREEWTNSEGNVNIQINNNIDYKQVNQLNVQQLNDQEKELLYSLNVKQISVEPSNN